MSARPFQPALAQCGSCLKSDGDPADSSYANYLSAYLATACAKTPLPTTAFATACNNQGGNVQNAFSTCTNSVCYCATLAASGAACSACLAKDGSPLDASYAGYLSVAMVTDCRLTIPAKSGGIDKLLVTQDAMYLGIFFWGCVALVIAGCFL